MRKTHIVLLLVAVVALAGCVGGNGATDDVGPNGEPANGVDAETHTVGIATDLTEEDQQEFADIEQELQQLQMQLQFGGENMTEEEMEQLQQEAQQLQQELQQAEQEAINENLETLRTSIEGTETVEIVDETEDIPLFVVEGDAGEILNLLNDEEEAAVAVSEAEGTEFLQPQEPMVPEEGGAQP